MQDHTRQTGKKKAPAVEPFEEGVTLVNSIVGEGTTFTGRVVLRGLLRIDGDFVGTINTSGRVLVGKRGRVESTVVAERIVIGGIVRGNIIATDKVAILSSGIFIGNITTPRLVVEHGGVIHGMNSVDSEKVAGVIERLGDLSKPQGDYSPWKE